MAVEILAAGTSTANSSTVTVTTAPVTISLSHSTGFIPAFTTPTSPVNGLLLQVQSPAGYQLFATLDDKTPNIVLTGPGVYRVRRFACSESIGAFRSDP